MEKFVGIKILFRFFLLLRILGLLLQFDVDVCMFCIIDLQYKTSNYMLYLSTCSINIHIWTFDLSVQITTYLLKPLCN